MSKKHTPKEPVKNIENPKKEKTDLHMKTPPSTGNINAHYVLFFLMFAVFLGCFTIVRPFIHIILLAVILSFVVSPVHYRIERLLKGRKNAAALVSCLLLTIIVVIPLVIIIFSLIQQGVTTFNAMHIWFAEGKYRLLLENKTVIKMYDWLDHAVPDIRKVLPGFNPAEMKIDKAVMEKTADMGKILLEQGKHIAAAVGSLIVKFFLFIFTFFFMIRDEKEMVDQLLHLIPMTRSQEEQIILKIKGIAKSALLGTLVTSLTQGIAGGIAFYICGLPGLFWGMIMTFSSLIPVVGTSLIWIPAAVYLLISGHTGLAVFLLIWCLSVVGLIDSLVRPQFMKGGSDMNTLMIFFAILGGIHTFGLLGILYGPLLFGLALVLLYIYTIEFKDFLIGQDNR